MMASNSQPLRRCRGACARGLVRTRGVLKSGQRTRFSSIGSRRGLWTRFPNTLTFRSTLSRRLRVSISRADRWCCLALGKIITQTVRRSTTVCLRLRISPGKSANTGAGSTCVDLTGAVGAGRSEYCRYEPGWCCGWAYSVCEPSSSVSGGRIDWGIRHGAAIDVHLLLQPAG